MFRDIALRYFGDTNNLVVFPEVQVRPVGSFDFVMVRHAPLSCTIEDFVIIEFQSDSTSNTGQLVQALRDFMQGKVVTGSTYGFGRNSYDTLKRAFTQVINKGVLAERWGHKVFWVLLSYLFDNLQRRYSLKTVDFEGQHSTVFAVYDLEAQTDSYELVNKQFLSSSVEDLLKALRNNPNLPSKDEFTKRLQDKLKAQLSLNINLR